MKWFGWINVRSNVLIISVQAKLSCAQTCIDPNAECVDDDDDDDDDEECQCKPGFEDDDDDDGFVLCVPGNKSSFHLLPLRSFSKRYRRSGPFYETWLEKSHVIFLKFKEKSCRIQQLFGYKMMTTAMISKNSEEEFTDCCFDDCVIKSKSSITLISFTVNLCDTMIQIWFYLITRVRVELNSEKKTMLKKLNAYSSFLKHWMEKLSAKVLLRVLMCTCVPV